VRIQFRTILSPVAQPGDEAWAELADAHATLGGSKRSRAAWENPVFYRGSTTAEAERAFE
jgi:hypothetical protein